MPTRIAKWNPRGEPTWPEWRNAKPGQRIEHTRSGATGTFARWPVTHPGRNPGYAVIQWDNGSTGRVVAYAYDLKVI